MMNAAKSSRTPAVVVGGSYNGGGLGVVRSLGRAGVPVIVVDRDYTAPGLHSRYARKVVVPDLSGASLVQNLLRIAARIDARPVLFLTSDEAVLAVSEHRSELERSYRLRLPGHESLALLMEKSGFHQTAIAHGFPVPLSIGIKHLEDLDNLKDLRFPVIVKPSMKTENYLSRGFERAYTVASLQDAHDVCRRILPVLPDLVVQEWIEGDDNEIYFCLLYKGEHGVIASFTGRKLSIWPPDVGTTAGCIAAPEVHQILAPLTEAFFKAAAFVGMGSMEYKRDARSGAFFMIEPTVGRVDFQEEIATLNGVNIPYSAYLHELGAEVPPPESVAPAIWLDSVRHWRAMRRRTAQRLPAGRLHDAYWRLSDPLPALVHVLSTATRTIRNGPKHRAKRRFDKAKA